MSLVPLDFLSGADSTPSPNPGTGSVAKTQEELDFELALKWDAEYQQAAKEREAQQSKDATIAQALALSPSVQSRAPNTAPTLSPQSVLSSEADDERIARELEEQFKEESRQRMRQQQAANTAAPPPPNPFAEYNPFQDSLPPPRTMSSRRATAGLSAGEMDMPLDSRDVIQCPICGEIFSSDIIETHVNICLDSEDEPAHSSSSAAEPPAAGQRALVVKEYDPVTKAPFECPICTEDVAAGAGYTYEVCQHQFCGECLTGYYTTLIMNGKVTELKCPNPTCQYKCTHKDIRFILPDDTFNKYVDFLRNAEINADPNIKWCPTPGCVNPVRRKDERSMEMMCDKCNFQFCFGCQKPHHEGKTCAEAGKWSLFSKDFRVLLWEKFHTKACPECDARIQKHGGCNHITCGNCKHEFCWQCMKPYKSSHYDDTRCTMYGNSPALFYAKVFAAKAMPRVLRRALQSSSDSSDYDSSDDEGLGTVIKEKVVDVVDDIKDRWENTKEDLSDRLENTKASIAGKWVQFKSLFDK